MPRVFAVPDSSVPPSPEPVTSRPVFMLSSPRTRMDWFDDVTVAGLLISTVSGNANPAVTISRWNVAKVPDTTVTTIDPGGDQEQSTGSNRFPESAQPTRPTQITPH